MPGRAHYTVLPSPMGSPRASFAEVRQVWDEKRPLMYAKLLGTGFIYSVLGQGTEVSMKPVHLLGIQGRARSMIRYLQKQHLKIKFRRLIKGWLFTERNALQGECRERGWERPSLLSTFLPGPRAPITPTTRNQDPFPGPWGSGWDVGLPEVRGCFIFTAWSIPVQNTYSTTDVRHSINTP